jgi:DNA-binding XRE family transcriptional regulator
MDPNPFELRAWRQILGMTQTAAAYALGVSPLTYRLWEWGKREPDNPRMVGLACDMLMEEFHMRPRQ